MSFLNYLSSGHIKECEKYEMKIKLNDLELKGTSLKPIRPLWIKTRNQQEKQQKAHKLMETEQLSLHNDLWPREEIKKEMKDFVEFIENEGTDYAESCLHR